MNRIHIRLISDKSIVMNSPNPKDLLLWTLRRNENDSVNLYDYLSSIMQISTGGNFLNFGYWDSGIDEPVSAQINLCRIIAKMGELSKATKIVDAGSGFSEPSVVWIKDQPNLDIVCLNINSNQLRFAIKSIRDNHVISDSVNLVQSTATKIPLSESSIDRVIALESAQHFRPLDKFVSESYRILKKNGLLVLAVPVLSRRSMIDIINIGILKLTWSSEHYDFKTINNAIESVGFSLVEKQFIGQNVYLPLADYYIKNHETLKSKILSIYPSYVEKILYKSILKMREASKNGIIDYVLVKCVKL